MRQPDPSFADPRLAVHYDFLDGARDDLDNYERLLQGLDAHHVIDVGCGTGSLAVRLAAAGRQVVALDPALASLDVAATKAHADRVTWLHGDATALDSLELRADAAVMTGNVAQVFVDDEDWHQTLRSVRGALRDGGWLLFESRRPEARDWERWNRPPRKVTLPDGRSAVVSREVTSVELPLVAFTSLTVIDGEAVASPSVLRFRSQDEIERDLVRHGFAVREVQEAPDRPGKELVFLAQC